MASLSRRELLKLLHQHGCHLTRQGKKHEYWWSPITRRHFSVPRKLKGEGTLQRILIESGVRDRRS
ncbi:MAG: type II toxin-antitoxin system HicA family toxin [Methyloceanibacter sp.]